MVISWRAGKSHDAVIRLGRGKQNNALRNRYRQSLCALACLVVLVGAWLQRVGESLAQQAPLSQTVVFGGTGHTWFSQYANPALVGALYQTPDWPLTGYYTPFPGSALPLIPADGIKLFESLKLNPMLGVAQMYTDNVFRTNDNRKSDTFTTFAPGIQAQLPFAGRHLIQMDYRTNIQYYANNPSNNVQDQTASGRVNLDFPGGLKIGVAGEHKLGHDPRGTALDTRNVDINKWEANGAFGHAEYVGAQSSIRMDLRTTNMTYLNNAQGPLQNRLINYAGLTLARDVFPKTALVANVGATQQIYENNKNLSSVIYQASGGVRWSASERTSGQVLAGVQHLQFSNAQVNQPPPLDRFSRTEDSFTNFFIMGNLAWKPTSLLTISLQGYQTVQQTAVLTSLFFVSTGGNLAISQGLTDSATATLNVGIERDKFTSGAGATSSANRTDLLKNVALGIKYRAVKWLGLSAQYIYEDRSSDQVLFEYHANTMMVSAQFVY